MSKEISMGPDGSPAGTVPLGTPALVSGQDKMICVRELANAVWHTILLVEVLTNAGSPHQLLLFLAVSSAMPGGRS